MDFLLEIIFEIILEGSFELGMSRKVPMPLRILALLVVMVVYGGLAVILGLAAADCWQSGDYIASLIIAAILIFVTIVGVLAIRKKLKGRNK